MDCIFCRIVAGEIPAERVYEDGETIAFLDIAPTRPGHVLVLPKKHVPNLEAIDGETLCAVIGVVKKIGAAVKVGLRRSGYNVVVNNDPIAGQVIPHLHFHVIPREAGDGLKPWPQGAYGPGEAESLAERLKRALAN